jgi:hypothetical protein
MAVYVNTVVVCAVYVNLTFLCRDKVLSSYHAV